MANPNTALKILMNLAKAQAVVARRFDRLSVHGIGFSDFMILYLLQQSAGGKMRRVDLADKIGLTASGVTRMLLPLEKRGLVDREAYERDARVSYVVLSEAGRQLYEDARKTANAIALELIPAKGAPDTSSLTGILSLLGGNLT